MPPETNVANTRGAVSDWCHQTQGHRVLSRGHKLVRLLQNTAWSCVVARIQEAEAVRL